MKTRPYNRVPVEWSRTISAIPDDEIIGAGVAGRWLHARGLPSVGLGVVH
jgi:hypothetical protein